MPPKGMGDDEPELRAPAFTGPHWNLFFDGSLQKQGAGAGVLLLTPTGEQFKYIAEYETPIFRLSIALSLGVRQLLVKGDSQLVMKQVKAECSCNDPQLAAYLLHVQKLEKDFEVLDL
jgi:hypothetical protein